MPITKSLSDPKEVNMSISTTPYAVLDTIVDTFFMTLEEMIEDSTGREVLCEVMEPYCDELRRRDAIIFFVED